MGAGGSIIEKSVQTVAYIPPDLVTLTEGGEEAQKRRKTRRKNLIVRDITVEKERVCLDKLLDEKSNLENEEEVKKLLSEALKGFFFLQNVTELQMNMFLKVITHQEYHSNEYVIREGEIGSTLYVIEKGVVDVLINGVVIRTLRPGQLFGELGLLFNAPRTASIRCQTDASFYLLERTLYKNIQKITNSASILQRNQWLLSCPELAHFTPIHMSRLFSTLQRVRYSAGDILYEQNKETDYVLLIERGTASISQFPNFVSTSQQNGMGLNQEDVDHILGIVRPKPSGQKDTLGPLIGARRGSSLLELDSPQQFVSSYLRRAASTGYGTEDPNDDSPHSTKQLSQYITREESLPVSVEDPSSYGLLHEGCIVGIPLLHASSNKSDNGQWKYITSSYVLPDHYSNCSGYSTAFSFANTPPRRNSAPTPQSTNTNSFHFVETPKMRSRAETGNGDFLTPVSCARGGYVISPITVTALTDIQCSLFTISAFEKAFGSLAQTHQSAHLSHDEVINSLIAPSSSEDHKSFRGVDLSHPPPTLTRTGTAIGPGKRNHKEKNLPFHPNLMKYDRILGEGGFATVFLGHYKTSDVPYAIKIMSKEKILDRGQLKHVLDEKKILNMFSSDFILHMYGSFQTTDWVAIVTDVCERGDLWSVIYETEIFQENECLPAELAQFYMVGIISALAHMHSRHIIFRDLKPENIMINGRGYIKLIDCGLAKQIPYEERDSEGVVNIVYKAHSLCGTPEYLAPEFLFNQGVDKAVDLWALGILLYEMYMMQTPFANEETMDNVEKLFIAIASVQGTPILPDEILDERDGSPNVASLIHCLLRSEPTERIGYVDTMSLLQHEYFLDFNHYAVLHQTYHPPYIPPEASYSHPSSTLPEFMNAEQITELLHFKSFAGNHDVFKDFGPLQ